MNLFSHAFFLLVFVLAELGVMRFDDGYGGAVWKRVTGSTLAHRE